MHKPMPGPRESQELPRKTESAIREALQHSGYHSLRRLVCEFDGRVVTLRGRVSTYYEKQIAQQIVLSRIEPHICFDNQIEVASHQRLHSPTTEFEPANRAVKHAFVLFS